MRDAFGRERDLLFCVNGIYVFAWRGNGIFDYLNSSGTFVLARNLKFITGFSRIEKSPGMP